MVVVSRLSFFLVAIFEACQHALPFLLCPLGHPDLLVAETVNEAVELFTPVLTEPGHIDYPYDDLNVCFDLSPLIDQSLGQVARVFQFLVSLFLAYNFAPQASKIELFSGLRCQQLSVFDKLLFELTYFGLNLGDLAQTISHRLKLLNFLQHPPHHQLVSVLWLPVTF